MHKKGILPNICTAFGLSCGVFVIFKSTMLQTGTATYQNVLAATAILMVAALMDLLDGAIARKMKVESEFGGIFDAMSDGITFGVAPACLILKTLSVEPRTFTSFFLTTGAMIYVISGVLRLVRFRVTQNQIQGDQEKIASDMKNFTGLPIPGGAAIATATTLFLMSDELQSFYPVSDEMRTLIATVLFFVLGFFMVSRWKFPSLKTLQIRVGSFQVILLIVFLTALVLYGALNYFPVVFASLAWAYFITAILLSIARIITGHRLKALEEFEPEEEDEEQ